jgi:vacuolar-type H+-ATPase subunit H
MDDRRAGDPDSAVVSEAYGTARELLRQAEEDAAQIRADADRYRRQREQEAELIVGKARRLLEMAEGRVAAPKPVVIDLDTAVPATAPEAWDLDASVVHDLVDEPIRPGSRRVLSDLDAIVATAVSNAIDRALPTDR